MNTTRKTILGGVLAVLLLVVGFSFPTTRALASQFLGIFRVQKFAPVSVSPAQLQMLENLAMDDGLYPGEITFADDGIVAQSFDDLATAAAFAQSESTSFYGVRTLENSAPSEIYVEGGGTATLTVNLEGARALLEAINADPSVLPDSLDGQDVTADTDVIMAQMWDDGTTLVQMPSPVFNYPTDVDPAPIGQALLQLLGMEEGEAIRLSNSIDWTNTLLMPIPTEFASFREVPIDGTTGLLIEALEGGETVLMWQNGNMVYLLSHESMDGDALLGEADALTWTFFE